MIEIPAGDLTDATTSGDGIYDVLMRANRAHLDIEFNKNRITGPEYSKVYLGSIQIVMQTALQFVLEKQKAANEAVLIEKQVLLAEQSILKTQAEIAVLNAQLANVTAQTAVLTKNNLKTDAEIALLNQQVINTTTQNSVLAKSLLKTDAEIDVLAQEALNAATQNNVLLAAITKATSETAVLDQQKLNLVTTNDNLIKEGCKLAAEFDVLMAQVLKVTSETELLTQKVVTERSQTSPLGVDDNSVVGRQKLLYQAQTEGFKRSSETAAAKLLVDSWAVRRTTDEGTVADTNNKLDDLTIGRAVNKMLTGVGA